MVRTETGCSDNGSAIACNVKLVWIHLSATDRFVQKASTENPEQQTIRFLIHNEGSLRKTGNEFSNGFLLNGSSLLTLTLWLLNLLPYRRLIVGGKVRSVIIPNSFNEIVEGSNAWDIRGLKSAEDGEKW